VLRSDRAGYAVHVWLSNDEENRRVYDRLLDMCVDRVMAARPRAFERRLRARDVVRPDGHSTDPCSVRARRAVVEADGIAAGCSGGVSGRRRTRERSWCGLGDGCSGVSRSRWPRAPIRVA